MSSKVKILVVVLALGMAGALGLALTRRPDTAGLTRARRETRECQTELGELKERVMKLRQALTQALARPESMSLNDPELLRLVGRPRRRHAGGGGDLSQAAVVQVVKSHRRELQTCYERALKRNADLRGSRINLHLTFTVRGNGKAKDVRFAPRVDAGLISCMVGAVRRWRFPAFGGEPVRVEVPVPLVPRE